MKHELGDEAKAMLEESKRKLERLSKADDAINEKPARPRKPRGSKKEKEQAGVVDSSIQSTVTDNKVTETN